MKYIVLKNSILDIGLKPSELLVYATLVSLKDKITGNTICSCKAISKNCLLSERTVYKSLSVLEERGLIKSKRRYNIDGQYISKIYKFKNLIGKGFFKLNVDIVRKGLSPSEFMVYCFMQKSANKKGEIVTSLKKMSVLLNTTVNTLIKAIERLKNELLIFKMNYITMTGAFGCSRYTIEKNELDSNKKFISIEKSKKIITLVKCKNNTIDLKTQYLWLTKNNVKNLCDIMSDN